MNFTDPSGYCFMGCFWKKIGKALGRLLRKFPIIGTIIKVAFAAVCTAVTFGGCAPVMAFIGSAFVAGVTTGSWSKAFRAGIIGAATAVGFNVAGSITTGLPGGAALASGEFGAGFGTTAHIFKIASHAAIGCLSAMAGGGKCGLGALSAGVSAGATPFYHTGSDAGNIAMAAAVGGVASRLGGGSFSDGAVTAAFGYMFNQMASRAAASRPAIGWGLRGALAGVAILDGDVILGVGILVGTIAIISTSDTPGYVVRLQAQGGGLEASVVINSGAPTTVRDGHLGLSQLAADIGPREAIARRDAFIEASTRITSCGAAGGCPVGNYYHSADGDVRVDINIMRGNRNLVPGGRSAAGISPTTFGRAR